MAKSDQSKTGQQEINIPVSNPHGVTAVYANNVGVGATLTEISLFFTEMGQSFSADPAPLPVQSNVVKAIVLLPPLQVISLIGALQTTLKQQQEHLQQQARLGQQANAEKSKKA